MPQNMSVVIDSQFGDENLLYSSMEQPENDTLHDSKSKEMEDEMSASNDHLEDGPHEPQHIFVLDRQSSLGKHDRRPSSETSSVASADDLAARSPRRSKQVYGTKKKQKLNARQRKRQLERNFGSDFKPGTIRHRLNFLQHNFGDQLTLIEESLPKTFFRNMNLETFIKNKMEQHEQHTQDASSTKRSPSFRRSPERQRKPSIKADMPEIKEKPHEETSEMAEIMTFAPLETPHFASVDHHSPSMRTSTGHFPLDRSAREWRLSKFLEESPPPSPVREVSDERIVSDEASSTLPPAPILDEHDTPAIEQPSADASPVEEEEEEKQKDAAAIVEPASVEQKEVPPPVAVARSNAPADVHRISATGIVEDVVPTPKKIKPVDAIVEEPVGEQTEESAAVEEPVVSALKATEESAFTETAPVEEEPASDDVAVEANKEEEPAVEEATTTEEPVVETPMKTDAVEVVGEDEVPSDDDKMGESSSSSIAEGVVEHPIETAETTSGGVVVETPVEPTPEAIQEQDAATEPTIVVGVVVESPTIQEGVASEQQEEEAPVSAQVKESASSIPEIGEDARSRESAKKAVEVVSEQAKPEEGAVPEELEPEASQEPESEGFFSEGPAPIATETVDDPQESKPEETQEGFFSEGPAPIAVDATETVDALQDTTTAAAVSAPPTTPIVNKGVVEEPSAAESEGVVEEPSAPESEGLVEESPAPVVNKGVVEEPPAVTEGVSEEPPAPVVNKGVVEEAPPPVVSEGVVEEPSAPVVNKGVVEESPAPVVNKGVVEEPPAVTEGVSEEPPAPVVNKGVVEEAPAPATSKGVVEEPPAVKDGVAEEPPAPVVKDGVAQEPPAVKDGVDEESPAPAIAIDTSAAPTEDDVVPSTPVGDSSVSSSSTASFESPRQLDAVELARLEQSTPVKVESEAPASAPDAVEQARLEQQTPVKAKTDEAAAAAPEEPKAEATDAAATTDATDENKDVQNCPSPSSVMDSELGDKETPKVKKQCALKENRKIRFADEAGEQLTKEYVIEREANYASRIVVMLLSPRDRKFEFLHAEYPLDESTTVQVLLEQVPFLATNDAFRTKKFNALLQTETSRQLDNNLALQDYCFKESEIVLGIPDDFTVANMTKMAVPLLLNKKLMKTVKQAIRKGRGLKTVQSGEEWRK